MFFAIDFQWLDSIIVNNNDSVTVSAVSVNSSLAIAGQLAGTVTPHIRCVIE